MPVLKPAPLDSRVRVARDLRIIEGFAKRAPAGEPDRLLTQAVHAGNDPLMPGGLAMVALAGASSQETYANLIDGAERRAIHLAEVHDIDVAKLMPVVEDDDWEPPLQTLTFWSEGWRREREMDYDGLRPTVASEAAFLRLSLEWAWANEVKWDDFVKDVSKLRGRLEAVLTEGFRPSMRGVPCMYDECRGSRLIRTTVATTDKKTGEKVWVLTDWHCPRCERSWDEESYQRHVYAAIHREKSVVTEFDGETEVWCTVDIAAKRVSRPESTVRVWLHREQVNELCGIGDHRRWRYVLLADVEARDQLARERWAKRVAAMKAKRGEAVTEETRDSA